ncbi:hypothetical protein RBSWK_05556 [Rhodopirellula baltica SWK14]|uniref:Uncharacterized protein n=1 Tax=Rhodopirellula baltica SWK14 TaxID=993516 RepID=L7C924_RHOBT|nr:hypothetical protein RBSWK_05556 [Rhodopirellula baltica SWK14]
MCLTLGECHEEIDYLHRRLDLPALNRWNRNFRVSQAKSKFGSMHTARQWCDDM